MTVAFLARMDCNGGLMKRNRETFEMMLRRIQPKSRGRLLEKAELARSLARAVGYRQALKLRFIEISNRRAAGVLASRAPGYISNHQYGRHEVGMGA
jgi:hypothetical protein